jgi:uncharacterized membrane protein
MTRDPMDYGWWLASRASGIVALALITLSVGVGLAMAGKAFRKPGLPRKLMALLEHAALGGLVAIAVYVLAVIHTLGAGSDVAWMRPAMLITGAPILYLLTLRMLPQRPRGERRTRTGTSAVPGAS